MDKLSTFMEEAHTHPSIQGAITDRLTAWRYQYPPAPPHSYGADVVIAVQTQDQIGWKSLMEGLPSNHWQHIQDNYYTANNITNKKSSTWLRKLLHHLHQLAWKQWDHRNKHLHQEDGPRELKMDHILHAEITKEYTRGTGALPPRDRTFFQSPLFTILSRNRTAKQRWMLNLHTARQRQARRQGYKEDSYAITPEREQIMDWIETGRAS